MSLTLRSSVWRPCWLWWLRLLMWQSADNHNNDVHKSTTSHVSVVWLMLYPAGRASPPPPLPPVSLFFPSSSFLCETICSSSSSITSSFILLLLAQTSSSPSSSSLQLSWSFPLHPPFINPSSSSPPPPLPPLPPLPSSSSSSSVRMLTLSQKHFC